MISFAGQIGLILIIGAEWVLADRMSVGTVRVLTYRHDYLADSPYGASANGLWKAVVALGRISDILGEPVETFGEQSPPTRLKPDQGEQLTFKHMRMIPRAVCIDDIDLISKQEKPSVLSALRLWQIHLDPSAFAYF